MMLRERPVILKPVGRIFEISDSNPIQALDRCVPPCAAKTCAVRPVFAGVEGSWGQQIQEFARKAMKANARPGAHSEAPG